MPVQVSQVLLRWLDSESLPHAIVGRDGSLEWANKAALAARAGAIEVQENAVRARLRAHQDALADAIGMVGDETETRVLSCDEGHTILTLTQVSDPSGRSLVGLKWSFAGKNFEVRYVALDTVFQLTPTEHSILMWLVRGRTADEVAVAAGKSLETVRSHIRQIYAKLNVRSREEMFFRIQPFRV